MTQWMTALDFTTPNFTPDKSLDLMETLGTYGAATAIYPDETGGSITLAIDADNPMSALEQAIRLVEQQLPDMTITSVEAKPWEQMVKENAEPTFPPVVSCKEIATMVGVTRQRAREFRDIPSFPKPILETSLGPFFLKTAVEKWAATRNRKAGRPRKAA